MKVVLIEGRTYRIEDDGTVNVVVPRGLHKPQVRRAGIEPSKRALVAAGLVPPPEKLAYRPGSVREIRREGKIHWRDVMTDEERAIVEPFIALVGIDARYSAWEKMPEPVRKARDRARTRACRMNNGDPSLGRVSRLRPGEDHPSARLTWAKVREIRDSTDPYTVLATRYGVHIRTIRRIRENKIWVDHEARREMRTWPTDRRAAARHFWAQRRERQQQGTGQ